MVNKNGNQGTRFESNLTSLVKPSERLPKQGVRGEPDVWWYTHPSVAKIRFHALAWKRLVKAKGKARRVPDGEGVVVVIPLDEYIELLDAYHEDWMAMGVVIQAKATERLNVTRVLHDLKVASQDIYGEAI